MKSRAVQCLNLEITRVGGARQREILLIGAHYDTVIGSSGANDNASGVSAFLELSCLFANIEPSLTVRFVAFVNEESPFFVTRQQGSMVYAEAARCSDRADHTSVPCRPSCGPLSGRGLRGRHGFGPREKCRNPYSGDDTPAPRQLFVNILGECWRY
jgi:Peptidase family M28